MWESLIFYNYCCFFVFSYYNLAIFFTYHSFCFSHSFLSSLSSLITFSISAILSTDPNFSLLFFTLSSYSFCFFSSFFISPSSCYNFLSFLAFNYFYFSFNFSFLAYSCSTSPLSSIILISIAFLSVNSSYTVFLYSNKAYFWDWIISMNTLLISSFITLIFSLNSFYNFYVTC